MFRDFRPTETTTTTPPQPPVDALLRCGYRVRGTVRSLTGKRAEHLAALAPGARHRLELVVADLLEPSSWPAAVNGATYVMHLASPFPIDDPEDEAELVRPAVDGTLNVLRSVGERTVVYVCAATRHEIHPLSACSCCS